MWLEAAFYYADHFLTTKNFVHFLEDDSHAVVEVKRIMFNNDVLNELMIKGLDENQDFAHMISVLTISIQRKRPRTKCS